MTEGTYITAENPHSSDMAKIISHRHDHGADFWTTIDHKLLKGAPYTTLESALYLLELGVPADDERLKGVAALIFENWKEDGRMRTSPGGGIDPCQTALAVNVLCRLGDSDDDRVKKSFSYFLDTQRQDGGWTCNKYSFGKGEEPEHSTPYTTLVVLEYPFRGYNLFYYVYVLSIYHCAQSDRRFLEALEHIKAKTVNGRIPVERVVSKLSELSFCQKGQTSELATLRYREILRNLSGEGLQERQAKQ